MKKISLILAVIMMLACMFVGCGSASDGAAADAYLGTWSLTDTDGSEYIYSFNADGTGYAVAMEITMDLTYEVDGKNLIVTIDGTGALEDMLGMSVDELLEAGYITQEDVDACITTETLPYAVKGDTLILGGDEFTKVTE